MMSQEEMTFEHSKLSKIKLLFAILSVLLFALVCMIIVKTKAAAKTDQADNENTIIENEAKVPGTAELVKEYNSIVPESSRIGYDHVRAVRTIKAREAFENPLVADEIKEASVDSADIEKEIIEPEIKEVVKVQEVKPAVVSNNVEQKEVAVLKESFDKNEEAETKEETKTETSNETEYVEYTWSGSVLTAWSGVNYGPSGKETYYNLWMGGVVSIMRDYGFDEENYPYWVREDGCKMLGPYIMVAANLDLRPRGSLIETSLGMGLVCDTGGFAAYDAYQLDIAVNW